MWSLLLRDELILYVRCSTYSDPLLTSGQTLVDTVVFHIDAATGEDATGKIERDDVLEGIDIVQGPIVESYLVQDEGKKVVMFLDEYLQVCNSLLFSSSLKDVL